jgi:hypothetical protein
MYGLVLVFYRIKQPQAVAIARALRTSLLEKPSESTKETFMSIDNSNLRIDDEFERLIPPLLHDEYRQLEDQLLREGCRDRLRVWYPNDGKEGPLLVDGHNRYRICLQHRLHFDVTEIELGSRESALLWIEQNQLGRRNLNDDQRATMAESVRRRIAKRNVAERNAANRNGDVLVDASNTTKKNSRKEVAERYNVPEKKLRHAKVIADAKEEEGSVRDVAVAVDTKVRAGEMSLVQAKREIEEKEKEKIFEAKLKAPVARPNGAAMVACQLMSESIKALAAKADFIRVKSSITPDQFDSCIRILERFATAWTSP